MEHSPLARRTWKKWGDIFKTRSNTTTKNPFRMNSDGFAKNMAWRVMNGMCGIEWWEICLTPSGYWELWWIHNPGVASQPRAVMWNRFSVIGRRRIPLFNADGVAHHSKGFVEDTPLANGSKCDQNPERISQFRVASQYRGMMNGGCQINREERICLTPSGYSCF